MGRINIRGGSPLRIEFEVDTGNAPPNDKESAPKDFGVKLVLHASGNWYEVERTTGGALLETLPGTRANMRVTGVAKQVVDVEYDQ